MGKYLRKNKPKRNIPLRIAAVLYCLTVVTTYLVSGLYARYTSSAQGSDQARVAKFSINGTCTLTEPLQHDFIPGDSTEISIVIHNNSEVAVEYNVEYTTAGNLPLTFEFAKVDNSLELTKDATNTSFTGQQLPGNHTDKYKLTIKWPEPTTSEAHAENLQRVGMVDYIAVTVTATQID